MKNKVSISTAELAKLLGISRIAVFKKIKTGQIPAKKVGRNYSIDTANLPLLVGSLLRESEKANIEKAVKRTIREYGQTLQLLGKE